LKFGTIEQTVFFEAAPDVIYDALLDPRKHSEFTGSPATTSAKKGATFTAWEGYITGKNLELVKGKKIVQEWKTTECRTATQSRGSSSLSPPKREGRS
jgi:activator of HSP90 ATPase